MALKLWKLHLVVYVFRMNTESIYILDQGLICPIGLTPTCQSYRIKNEFNTMLLPCLCLFLIHVLLSKKNDEQVLQNRTLNHWLRSLKMVSISKIYFETYIEWKPILTAILRQFIWCNYFCDEKKIIWQVNDANINIKARAHLTNYTVFHEKSLKYNDIQLMINTVLDHAISKQLLLL